MMTLGPHDSLDLDTLSRNYRGGLRTPEAVLRAVLQRIDACDDPAVWIARLSPDRVFEQLRQAQDRLADGIAQPLLGVPFAIKDNIDLADVATTAACAEFSYVPDKSAEVVRRLLDAGAIAMGKTNLDQFATGLVGTRSPYGACRNPFDGQYISGGSSSGSAVAVARGLVSFALGTDTAGSGRVPAGFNNIVGLKPTVDLLSTAGVVPACKSLDCVSVFALTCEDAASVMRIAAGPSAGIDVSMQGRIANPRIGVPRQQDLEFFGDDDAARKYQSAVEYFRAAGHSVVTFDFTPFARTARLLYEGPWVAERMSAVKEFVARCPDAMLPVTRSIIDKASQFDAVATFEAFYQLKNLRAEAKGVWDAFDIMLLPTSGTIYRIADVNAEPVRLNTNLGYYTNFVNLLDLCALAVPNGFRNDRLPTGVTLLAPAGRDEALVPVGDAFHRATTQVAGATGRPIPVNAAKPQAAQTRASDPSPATTAIVQLAVVGAHLSGQPLNAQLTSRGATLVRSCRTAPAYRLYALANTLPPKPGLVRVESGGREIEVEVWSMSAEAFGSFVAAVPAPMTIGTATLEDGTTVKGFLCEPIAIEGAADISSFGGWRAYLSRT